MPYFSRRLQLAHLVPMAAAILLVALTGCAPMQYKAGNDFDPTALGTALKAGTATRSEVRGALGAPYGEGRAQMPYHASPRDVWTYFVDSGEIQIPGGMQTHRRYLFVFFDQDRLDGWYWFDSALAAASK